MSLHISLSKVLFIASLLKATVSQAAPLVNDFAPFVGLSVGNYKVFFEPGYGNKIFRKDAVFYNIYAGIKFNECIGLEIGHQHDNQRKKLKDSNHYPGNVPFHRPENGVYFKTYLNIKHTYLGITFDYLLFNNLSIGTLTGLSISTLSASHSIYKIDEVYIDPNMAHPLILQRHYKKTKLVTTHSIRMKYKISESIGFRIGVNYFRLSRIGINSKENGRLRPGFDAVPNARIKVKTPMSYSIGLNITL